MNERVALLRIGAHVSIAGGLWKAIEKATRIGADCAQIFISPPQGWASPKHTAADDERFKLARQEAGITPVFLHTIYLINLATTNDSLRRRSIDSLVTYLQAASELNVDGVVTHLGSKGSQTEEEAEALVAQSLQEVLSRSPDDVILCLETSAGAGGIIGSSFVQISRIATELGVPSRIGLCLDTAHVFAAGYDVKTRDGLERVMEEIDHRFGIASLRLVHANDSKTPLGSRLDRHENIGRGFIGEDGFRNILQHPTLQEIPFVIEVPGFDQEGPDAENIAILRRLAGRETS